ncbi:MAG TPA: hypothetical protein VH143_05390 [Kofleriaceae bacterium]|nr:hypothetical protein [Kofleriaceae bacterium]
MRELDLGDRSAVTMVRDREAIRRALDSACGRRVAVRAPSPRRLRLTAGCYDRPMYKLALVGLALAAAIAWAYVSSTDWFTLWRDRRDPDANTTKLCETRGRGALPAIYRAFGDHGNDDDVAKFRVAIVDEVPLIDNCDVAMQMQTELEHGSTRRPPRSSQARSRNAATRAATRRRARRSSPPI